MAKRPWTRRIAGGLSTLAALVLAATLLAACGESVGDDGTLACDDSLPDASLVIVSSPVGGAEVASRFEVNGCSRTFESNVQSRLSDQTGAVLASGHTSGGGVDGPVPFAFTVDYEAAERQIATLEVFEEDVSEGQGFPPPRAVVPVVISASG